MSTESNRPFGGSGFSRRDFLRVGGLSVMGLSLAEQNVLAEIRERADRRSCIFLLLTGGPSQLETFDPKPDAPSHIRGPMRAISTAVPGCHFSDALPKLASRADRFSVIRTLTHDAAPIHETGLQLLQTGRLATHGVRFPHFGSIIAQELGARGDAPPFVILPKLLGNTGVEAYRGQSASWLSDEFRSAADSSDRSAHNPSPVTIDLDTTHSFLKAATSESDIPRRMYGGSRVGRLCLRARQLVEAGVRCVFVNLFDELAGNLTWDCHGKSASTPGTLFDYRDTLGPQFDQAVAALLDDLQDRGLLDDTLVVATGEFGRSPRINNDGGRDHWPGCWSALLAGAGVPAGGVIGCSDSQAASPIERPVSPRELFETVLRHLGVAAYQAEPAADENENSAPVLTIAAGIEELLSSMNDT